MGISRRHQVFISSTFTDLIEERKELIQALLELDCIPAGMELFPAADDDAWTLIRRVIDDCDYYLVVVGGRYGSVGPTDLSYTEMEYRYALETKKPIIAFLHKNPDLLPAGKTDRDPILLSKLSEFRALCEKKTVRHWETPKDLGSIVSRSLIKLIRDVPTVGWVRGDAIASEAAQNEILALRTQLAEITALKIDTRKPDAAVLEKLSQGKDRFELEFVLQFGSFIDRQRVAWAFESTWDDVFSLVSPSMMDEADTTGLKRRISAHFLELDGEEIFKYVESEEKSADPDETELNLTDTTLDQIIVQFNALGLIERGSKRRPINDKKSYWALTRIGEQRMYELRAIRKSEPAPVAPMPSSTPKM